MQHQTCITDQSLTLTTLLVAVVLTGCGGEESTAVNSQPPVATEQAGGTPEANDPQSIIPGAFTSTSIGDVLVSGAANRSMYTFANDTDGVSNCTDACVLNWPVVEPGVDVDQGQFSTITRTDGVLQLAFKNRPLYFYQGDAAEGETSGEGIGNVWFVARPDPVSTGETSLGTVLTGQGSINNGGSDPSARIDQSGMTLYTFRNDSPGTSVCNGDCAVTWPPLFADQGSQAADNFTLVTRDDGSLQWAVNGQALYFFQGDSSVGDTNGDGLGGVWDVALPPAQ